jgi:predicted transcriptional regulator
MYLKDRSNADGECWPAIKTIARDTSMSVSTVKRALADLMQHGFLRKERRYRENGGNSSNKFYLK